MHPVVIMAYDKSPAINKAVAALEEAGMEVRVLNTNHAKLADFLGALAGEDDEDQEHSDDVPPEDEDTPPADDEEQIATESLTVFIDDEPVETVLVEGESVLIPNGRMVGTKAAYMVNESHFAFWPGLAEDGLFDMTHNVQVRVDGDRAVFTDVKIAEAAARPQLRLNESVYLKLVEGKVKSELTMAQVMGSFAEAVEDIVDKYKSKEVKDSTTASAPDTSKFIAHRSGKISHDKNVHIHGGYYGFSKTYEQFLKIGGGLPSELQTEMVKELFSFLSDDIDVEVKYAEHVSIECSDGSVHLSREFGTNWGGVGAYKSKA